MKRCVLAVLLACSLLLCVACGTNNDKDGETPPEPETLVMTEVAATASAELGERFDIPEVTAKKGKKEVTVTVTVKDSKGQGVELLGRGTRFAATDPDGYTITYTAGEGEERITKTTTVTCADTKGPVLTLPAAAYGMTVQKGGTVSVPVASWEDKSGTVTDVTYTVTYNGNPVTVTQGTGGASDTFEAPEYGDYIITYSAKDAYNNQTTQPITVACVRSVLLCGFDGPTVKDNAWANNAVYVTEHAVEGANAMKIPVKEQNENGPVFEMLSVYPDYYDLSGFDKLQITVWSDKARDSSDHGFYLLNKRYPLEQGENIITISKEDLDAQYPNGKIPSENPKYGDRYYLYFQIWGTDGFVWVDNLIGIFDNYTVDTAKPVIDFGRVATDPTQTDVTEGKAFAIPAVKAYDNSMESITVTATVTKKDGTDITEEVKAGTFKAVLADESYTITYTAKDAAENQATPKTVTVTVKEKVVIPDTPAAEYFPDEKEHAYDMLDDCESAGVAWTNASDHALSDEHVMSGSHSIVFTSTQEGKLITLAMKKDGKNISEADWQAYSYIQVYVYSDDENAKFHFYDKAINLKQGPNSVTITSADILTEIAKASNVYSGGNFFCKVSNGTVYIDAIIGVYPTAEKPVIKLPDLPDTEAKDYYPDSTKHQYDVLNDCETAGVFTGSEGDTCELSDKHAMDGTHSVRYVATGTYRALKLKMLKDGKVLKNADWKAYAYIQVYVYAEDEGAQFYFLNDVRNLKRGPNTVTITSANILKQITSNASAYNADGYFWYQVCTGTIYVDAVIGVYPEGYDPSQQPEEPFVPAEKPDAVKNWFPTDRAYDVLQNFDTAGAVDTWFFNESEGITTTCAVKGNAFHVTGTGAWSKLPIMVQKDGKRLTESDWKTYEKFRMVIYAESACTFTFYLKTFDLVEGWNVIEISSANMWTEISKDEAAVYPENCWLYCQVNGTGVSLYFDELIGIYPASTTPDPEPDPEPTQAQTVALPVSKED